MWVPTTGNVKRVYRRVEPGGEPNCQGQHAVGHGREIRWKKDRVYLFHAHPLFSLKKVKVTGNKLKQNAFLVTCHSI
jgi:hypothetical protein